MKKNIRKVPTRIVEELKDLPRYVVAGCAKTFDAEALAEGALKHLGVSVDDGKLGLPKEGVVVPPSRSGKYSRRNREGYVVVRKDLPKERFSVPVEAPNWGDAVTYGTHTVLLPHERYPRDEVPPSLNAIGIRAVNGRRGLAQYSLVFEVDEVLDQKSEDFTDRLLRCLNLLQENVGEVGVQRSGASPRDYIASLDVAWEILPPGTKEETIARLFAGRAPSAEQVEVAGERYAFFSRLKPLKHVFGRSGLQRYFGAMIRPDLVVFENLEYGNAIYVMFGDWEALSQKNRVDLLAGRHGDDFERVVHSRGWKSSVEAIVEERLKASGTKK